MDFTFIIFALSLLAIILMISHKALERRAGKSLLFANLRQRADEIAAHWHGSVLEKVEFFTVENLKTVGRLAYVLCFRLMRVIRQRTHSLYVRFHREMNERAILKTQSSPSFFLKNISDYKDKPAR